MTTMSGKDLIKTVYQTTISYQQMEKFLKDWPAYAKGIRSILRGIWQAIPIAMSHLNVEAV